MDVLAWVRSEVEPLAASLQPSLPDASTPLCNFLRDGRALVLLTAALTAAEPTDNQQPQDVAALPKNLQRSLHQTTTFHALERIQFFIKWCRADAALDAFVVFSSVQLLDEQNDKVVSACLEALRNKYRPQLKGAAVAPASTPIAISTTTTPVAAAVVASPVASLPATPSKSSGLWVKRSSAHQLLASPASSRNNSNSSNQSSHEAVAQPPVSSLSNRLNAFLNKFPSETNVLTGAPIVANASPVGVDEVQPQDDDEDEDNNEDDEDVEAYNEDEEDVALPTEPRAPFADALSPRSEHERSSFGSSLSFSFTSDPRHHESLTEDAPPQPDMNLSFSSVLSSPPASPKPAPRLRIPSIFERNAEKEKVAAVETAAVATDRSSLTLSSTSKDEAPRAVSKLSIPAAFSSSSSSTVSIDSTASAVAVETASAVATEAAAATPKPVSKLSIPAAFVRTSSTSSSTSDRSSFSKTTSASNVVAQEASSPQSALVKRPSRLKIPSAFASGAAAATAATATAAVVVAAATAPVDEPVAEANSSPLAAFVTSPSTTNHSASSASASPSRPANKLAAFLSTVEVANAFVIAAGEASPDNVETAADQQERFSDDESDSDESVDADDAVEVAGLRFSLSQETAIGLPDDSTPLAHNRVHHSLSLSAEPPATNEAAPEDVEEEHSIEHHDHTDSEQPFFVVEEVSMTKPPTSSKLYAFLSAVDSTESPRFSHTSSSGAGGDDKSHLDEAAASAVACLSGGGSHGSQRNSVEGHTTASEHSECSPSNSVTSQSLALAASSNVILEKERLSGENLALQLKLRTVEARLSAKDVEAAALRAEIVVLQAQLAAAATPSDFRLKSAAEAFKAQIAEAKAAHMKTIKAAQAAREQLLSEKKLLEDQLRSIKTPSQSSSSSAVAALTAQLAEAKATHLKTIKTAQATREQFASQTKLLEGQLRGMKQQSHSAAAAFSSRLAEAKKAHVKTIKAAQFSREHFASENVKFMTLALQKQSAAAALNAQVTELKKAHLKTIKTAQFSREQLLSSGATPVQTTTITAAVRQSDSALSTLAEQNRAFEQKLQAAKDSEEAARNSVQLALMELIRSQQATIAQLSQRAA